MSHRARKRFGQHFLHDPGVIRRIVAAIAPAPDDLAVEIGPGTGALSVPLLARVNTLHVVELDRDVIPPLKAHCNAGDRLIVHSGDALDFDFGALGDNGRQLRLCGNLPYNISTPLIFHLLQWSAGIRDMHFMLQKEVVDRLVAGPGDKHYGRLSVMTRFHCEAHALFDVGPGAFKPPPRVDSSVVRLVPHRHPPIAVRSTDRLRETVTLAFNQRRKTLKRIFKARISENDFHALDIDPGLRPERLDLAAFGRISDFLTE